MPAIRPACCARYERARACSAVLFDVRHFVGNFVGNFVDAIYVREKAVKLGKVFDEVPDEGQQRLTR